MKDVACRLYRQCGNGWTLAMWGNNGDASGNAKTYVVESTQLLHHRVYLPGVSSMRVENELCVIEEQSHLVRGQE